MPTITQALNSPILSQALLNQRAPNRFTWMPASQRATPLTRILAIAGSTRDTQQQVVASRELNGLKCVVSSKPICADNSTPSNNIIDLD